MFGNMCSLGSMEMKCKVNIEGVTLLYVEPLYGKPPKIIFDGYIHKDRS
jgi:hypothetical protein